MSTEKLLFLLAAGLSAFVSIRTLAKDDELGLFRAIDPTSSESVVGDLVTRPRLRERDSIAEQLDDNSGAGTTIFDEPFGA
ncbi:MAG: hypothetical protein GWO02_05195 [Gammaproteobacteria bacterium]|nr:hypothetical protein [Gammaproteobacteria bacterium]